MLALCASASVAFAKESDNKTYPYIPLEVEDSPEWAHTPTPTPTPTQTPTYTPTPIPTATLEPTRVPTKVPTTIPTNIPTNVPAPIPTQQPVREPLVPSQSTSSGDWRTVVCSFPWPCQEAISVALHESGGDIYVRNHQGSGACGLFQHLPCVGLGSAQASAAAAYAKWLACGGSFYCDWYKWW